jgi:hypothetical protein
MSARADLIEHFASVMYENDNAPEDWHHAKPEDREEYLRIAAAKVETYHAEVLNSAERAVLRYALELAGDKMATEPDEFAAVDRAALTSLKRLAGEEVPSDEQPTA